MQLHLNCVKCGYAMRPIPESTEVSEEGYIHTYHRCEGGENEPGCGAEVELVIS